MEIQLLKLTMNDADLNHLASQCFVWPEAIRDVQFAVTQEGVWVRGTYRGYIGIPFQVLWELSVFEGKVIARIERVRAGFISIGLFKDNLLKIIAAATNIEIRNRMLVLDADTLLIDKGWPVRLNFFSIRCTPGTLIFESRAPDHIHEAQVNKDPNERFVGLKSKRQEEQTRFRRLLSSRLLCWLE